MRFSNRGKQTCEKSHCSGYYGLGTEQNSKCRERSLALDSSVCSQVKEGRCWDSQKLFVGSKREKDQLQKEKKRSQENFTKKWPEPLGRLSERTPTLEMLLSCSLGDWTNSLTWSSASSSRPTSISTKDSSVELGWAPWVKDKALQGCPLSDKFFHWMILQALKHNYVCLVPTTFWGKMLACAPIPSKIYMQTLSHTAY